MFENLNDKVSADAATSRKISLVIGPTEVARA